MRSAPARRWLARRAARSRAAVVALLSFAIFAAGPAPARATHRAHHASHHTAHHRGRRKAAVDLPCSNPANHRRAHGVARGARVRIGGQLRCFALALTRQGLAGPEIFAGPVGYRPDQIRAAYGLAGLQASGRTVAIVDAFDDPTAESDLATYRNTFGLPPCTSANGCFTKVNQNGFGSSLPAPDYGWADEISLDLDAVSAACPTCHILLVEANSASTDDLVTAEDTAAHTWGVAAISNSWGGAESSSETSYDSHFNHHGVAITASSGDSGYGVEYPAASQYVTAVGGTTLFPAPSARGFGETAWWGAGSGCSAYEPKPSWQQDGGCGDRTVADVSAVANPFTGLAVYDTYNNCTDSLDCDWEVATGIAHGMNGWSQVGGTSLSSPLIASVYALAGNTGQISDGSYPYGHASSLTDVWGGANGACYPAYLCVGVPGYDGPTGLGTPNGAGAF